MDALDAAGVRHAFTTRHHARAITDVAASPALRALGAGDEGVRWARQVHGTTCLVADARPPGEIGEGDALITTRPGAPLAVFTADCVAVVVAEPERGVLAVAHAGWRGTVAGILGRLVRTLAERFAVRPERLRAAIGPSIGPCCYEVDEPVVGPLRAAFPARLEPLGRGRPAPRASGGSTSGAPTPTSSSPRDARQRDREPAALHRVPARPVLLVPQGGADRAAGRAGVPAVIPRGRFLGGPLAKRLQ